MHDYRFDFMQRGMTGALEHFKRKKSGATSGFLEDVEIELVEVLLWVAAINERIYNIGGEEYKQWRASLSAGRIDNALRFVRNAYVHRGHLVRWWSGYVSDCIPLVFHSPSLKWKPLENVGNTGKADAEGEALYRDVLQGREVAKTLEEAHDWLASELQQYREVEDELF